MNKINKMEDKTLTLSDVHIKYLEKDYKEIKHLFKSEYKDDYIRSRNENYNNMSKRLSKRRTLGRK